MPDTRQLADSLAFIFDLDGVIMNSMPVHNVSWQAYLSRHGIEADIPTIEGKMLGKHNDEIVETFFGKGLSPDEIARHGYDKEALFREMVGEQLPEHLVPGVADFVTSRRDLPLAVASNAEPANVEFVLSGSGLRSCFRVVLDGHQVERPKPHPEIYLLASELLEVAPENCIVFEDSETGVNAARDAGMRVVGLLTTASHLEGCDLLIPDFEDKALPGWLRRCTVG